jgi:hypothetical protein
VYGEMVAKPPRVMEGAHRNLGSVREERLDATDSRLRVQWKCTGADELNSCPQGFYHVSGETIA